MFIALPNTGQIPPVFLDIFPGAQQIPETKKDLWGHGTSFLFGLGKSIKSRSPHQQSLTEPSPPMDSLRAPAAQDFVQITQYTLETGYKSFLKPTSK